MEIVIVTMFVGRGKCPQNTILAKDDSQQTNADVLAAGRNKFLSMTAECEH